MSQVTCMIDRWIDTVSREWSRTEVVEKIGHTVHFIQPDLYI